MAAYVTKGNRNAGENSLKERLASRNPDEDSKSALEIAGEIEEAMRSPSEEDRKRFLDYISSH